MPKGCQFNQGQLPMSDVQAKVSHLEVIFHNDDETPVDFVIELLHSVFKKQIADAVRFTEAIKHHGQASCGTYPHDVAAKLLDERSTCHLVLGCGARARRLRCAAESLL